MQEGNRKAVVVAVAIVLSISMMEGNVAEASGIRVVGLATSGGYITGDSQGGDCSIAMGARTKADGNYSTAIGNLSWAIGEGSFAGGTGYIEGPRFAPFIHYAGTAYGKDSFAFGLEAVAGAKSGAGTAADSYVYSGDHSIAMGYGALASAESSVALGAHSEAKGANALALIGGVASGVNAIAIGSNAQAMAENSVAIGTGSVASAANEVSVGSDSQTRKVTHVTAGALNETSTDAINGSQLYSEQQARIAATTMSATGNYFTQSDSIITAVGKVDTQVKANATAISAEETRAKAVEGALDTRVSTNAENIVTNATAIRTHVDDTIRHISAEDRSYWNAKADKSYVDTAIYDQDKRMEQKVNRLGAKSAAIAALHPMSFDEEHKVSASAGVGTYGGENAAAVGVFFRPTENLMFNLGGAAGRGSVMGNLGVSYRFGGSGSSIGSLTASQMAMQINALRDTNRSVEAQLKASLSREEASEKRAKVSRTEVAQLKKRVELASSRIEQLEKQNVRLLRDFAHLKALVQQMAKAKSR